MATIPSIRHPQATELTDSDYEPTNDWEPVDPEEKNQTDRISLSPSDNKEKAKSVQRYKAKQTAEDRDLAENVRDLARQEKEKKWLALSFLILLPAIAGLGWLIYPLTTKESASKH